MVKKRLQNRPLGGPADHRGRMPDHLPDSSLPADPTPEPDPEPDAESVHVPVAYGISKSYILRGAHFGAPVRYRNSKSYILQGAHRIRFN